MNRFHDSRFQGVRLVCRLRRGSASTTTPTQTVSQQSSLPTEDAEAPPKIDDEAVVIDANVTAEPEPIEKVKEKFFVVKSLTVEDLERSVVSGIWATQAHNEVALNTAYQVRASPLCIQIILTTTGCRERLLDFLSEQVRRIFRIRSDGVCH